MSHTFQRAQRSVNGQPGAVIILTLDPFGIARNTTISAKRMAKNTDDAAAQSVITARLVDLGAANTALSDASAALEAAKFQALQSHNFVEEGHTPPVDVATADKAAADAKATFDAAATNAASIQADIEAKTAAADVALGNPVAAALSVLEGLTGADLE